MKIRVFDSVAAAMAAFALVAVAGIAMRPLLPIDETRYLAVAWEMRLSGDWLVPHLNGALYTHKPPLLFWLINVVWSVTGVSEVAARLVGPAAGTVAIWQTARLARRLWPEAPVRAARAAWGLAGLSAWAIYAGLTMFDALLSVAVLGGMLALAGDRPGGFGWVGLGLAFGFGVLAKGPVVLVHLVPVALLMPLLREEAWAVALRRLGLALGLGLVVVALWLVPAILRGGAEYRDAVIWTQSAGRVADPFDHGRPVWFFAALLPLMLWPWLWSAQVWRGLRAAPWRGDFGLRFAALWFGATLLAFSLIASKQAHYLVPALPAAALALAGAVRPEGLRAPLAGVVPGLLGLAALALAFGRVPDAHLARVAGPPVVMALAGLLFLGLAAAALRWRGGRIALLGLGLVVVADLVFLLGAPGEIYAAQAMAQAIAASDGAGIGLVGEGYAGQFSFAARLEHPVVVLEDRAEAEAFLAAAAGRVVMCRAGHDCPAGPPAERVTWRGLDYGVWRGLP